VSCLFSELHGKLEIWTVRYIGSELQGHLVAFVSEFYGKLVTWTVSYIGSELQGH
jgi:hypothetical protein